MAARRNVSGWEIMRRIHDQSAGATDEHEPRLSARARRPVVLRLPRGFIVLGILAAAAILCVAYGVGRSRGYDAGVRAERNRHEMPLVAAGQAPVPSGQIGAGQPAAPADGSSTNTAPPRDEGAHASDDPRQAGLNYFVLARYPADEAQRLVDFLTKHGVEAAAVSSDNDDLFLVVSLRGFASDEVRSTERQMHERMLRQVGRLWKDQQQGAGDLSDMYLKKHRP